MHASGLTRVLVLKLLPILHFLFSCVSLLFCLQKFTPPHLEKDCFILSPDIHITKPEKDYVFFFNLQIFMSPYKRKIVFFYLQIFVSPNHRNIMISCLEPHIKIECSACQDTPFKKTAASSLHTQISQ